MLFEILSLLENLFVNFISIYRWITMLCQYQN